MTSNDITWRPGIVLVCAALLAITGTSQTAWTGVLSSDWDVHGNWTVGVPSATTNVDIPAGTPFAPITSGSTKSCRDLVVQAGATLTLGAGAPLEISRHATVDGTISGSAPVIAVGSASRSWTTGAAGSFGDVELGSANDVTFSGTVSGGLTVTSGTVQPGPSSTLHVQGDASFSTGTVAGPFNGGVVDVDGDLDFAGSVVTNPPPILCGGDFTADTDFAPLTSSVTLDGAAPQTLFGATFNRITIAAGASVTTGDDLSIRQDLRVDGTFVTTGQLDVDRHVTINGMLDFGGDDHTIGGNFNCPGSFSAAGKLTFDEGVGASIDTVQALGDVDVAKLGASSITFGSVTVAGQFTVFSGAVRPGPSSTLQILGDASFFGGSVAGPFNGGVIDVDGNVDFAGASVTNPPPLHCAGDFTADPAFAPLSQTVTLDGTTPQTVVGQAFNTLSIAPGASVTTADDLFFGTDLRVDGVFVTSGRLDVNRTVKINGMLDFGVDDHTVGGSFDCPGSFNASGKFTFDEGNGGSITTTQPLGDVDVAKSSSSNLAFNGVTVSGDLTLVSGTITVDGTVLGNFTANAGAVRAGPNATFHVMGDASFAGGVVEAPFGGAVIDVDGDIDFTGAAAASPPPIRCAGDFTADPAFAPLAQSVILDGTAPQTLSGSTFHGLTVEAGANVTTADDLTFGSDLRVDGTFVTSAQLDVNRHLTINGVLDFGGGDHTVGGNFTCPGAFNLGGKLTFDDGTPASVSSMQPFGDVDVAKSGSSTVTFDNVTVAGDFALISGVVRPGPLATLQVLGDASLSGGEVSGPFNGGMIDVDGDVAFVGTTAVFPPAIRCGGDFTADGMFAPASQTVFLDGPAGTTFAAAVAPGTPGTLEFHDLVVENAARTPLNDVTVDAANVTIANGGTLDVGAHTVTVPAGAIIVDGMLSVAAGGELALGAGTSVDVRVQGTLLLVGNQTLAASVAGHAGGGYSLVVDGTLAASDFVFTDMDASGILISQSAVLAPAPADLRRGRFDRAAAVGGPLLDIRRPAPTTLTGLEFENTNGNAAFNVRCGGGSTIFMDSFLGAFAGPTFEDDPGGLVVWSPPSGSQLGFFAVTALAEAVRVEWTTTLELDVQTFRVSRAPTPAGPYAVIATKAPGMSAYETLDGALVAGQAYSYRLEQVNASDGQVVVLATAITTPFSSAPPSNVLDVGPAAPFASIQAAIDAAAAAGSVVRVAAGTYPSFVIDATVPDDLRIVADGSGPVLVDTTSGPVTIQDRVAGHAVTLEGLEIGTTSTAVNGLMVTNCQATVLLDGVTAESSTAAVRLDVAGAVALQSCALDGAPGLLSLASTSQIVGGSVDSLDLRTQSDCRTCDVAVGSTTTDSTATITNLPGVMPTLLAARTASVGYDFNVSIQTNPFETWYLLGDVELRWYDPGNPALELVGLIDADSGVSYLGAGLADATGFGTRTSRTPAAPALIGLEFTLQALSYDFLRSIYRWSTAAPVLLLP